MCSWGIPLKRTDVFKYMQAQNICLSGIQSIYCSRFYLNLLSYSESNGPYHSVKLYLRNHEYSNMNCSWPGQVNYPTNKSIAFQWQWCQVAVWTSLKSIWKRLTVKVSEVLKCIISLTFNFYLFHIDFELVQTDVVFYL